MTHLDGVDVNDQQAGSAFFSVLRLTPDSLQEFRVVTTNANANQGRSSGARSRSSPKSGTNSFHGSLFKVHRNTATSANNSFNSQTRSSARKVVEEQFRRRDWRPDQEGQTFLLFQL